MMLRLAALAGAALLALAAPADAYDGIVEKKTFAMKGPYKTLGAKEIKDVKIGYETIGKLNAAGDNAILVPHFYSGNSHFAGKYKAEDKVPGYWDAIVGPGKPLDTEKYFLVGVDSLCNLNTRDGVTVTTGPASIDPATGKPYGTSFPPLEIGDFVQVQKALLDELGVKRLHAVMGASMGAIQSWDWAARYPDFVPRIVSVIGTPAIDAYGIMMVGTWADAITADPAWNGGDYYGKAEPIAGLTMAFKLVNLNARAPAWASQAFGRKPADPAKDPRAAWGNLYAIDKWNEDAAAARAKLTDANNFLCLARANQTFVLGSKETVEEGLRAVKAKALLLPAKGDLLLFPELSRQARDILKAQGKSVEYQELEGPLGHLDGVAGIAQAAPTITKFLAE
jgi:homoserine O-acetyltransferase